MLTVSLRLMNSGWRRLLKTWLWISFDFFQKTSFPKFELLNSGCSLSVGAAYLLFLQYIFTKCIARVPHDNGYWSCLVVLCTAVALCFRTIFFYFANSFVNLHINSWFQLSQITSSMQYADLLNFKSCCCSLKPSKQILIWTTFFNYFVGK